MKIVLTEVAESLVFSFDDVSYLMFFFIIILSACDFQDSQGHQARRECRGNRVLLVPQALQVMTYSLQRK